MIVENYTIHSGVSVVGKVADWPPARLMQAAWHGNSVEQVTHPSHGVRMVTNNAVVVIAPLHHSAAERGATSRNGLCAPSGLRMLRELIL